MLTKEDLKNKKVWVGDEEMSRRVQEKLFELGFQWFEGKFVEPYYKGLFIGKSLDLGYKNDIDYFLHHSNEEIPPGEILKMETPKSSLDGKVAMIDGVEYRLEEVE